MCTMQVRSAPVSGETDCQQVRSEVSQQLANHRAKLGFTYKILYLLKENCSFVRYKTLSNEPHLHCKATLFGQTLVQSHVATLCTHHFGECTMRFACEWSEEVIARVTMSAAH